jgi:predicted nuclease of predicted toxin-antitoxin system
MGISPKTGQFLIQQGYDAVHLIDIGMERLSDIQILKKSLDEKRILLTHDLDFGQLLAISGKKQPSVVIFRLTDMRPANINKLLQTIIDRFSDTLEKGAILSIGDKRIRCHPLPI